MRVECAAKRPRATGIAGAMAQEVSAPMQAQPTPHGYCECGCGRRAPVADRNHAKYGHVKGEPMRFIRGHAMRGRTLSLEARAKVGEAHRGRPKSPEQREKMSVAQRGSAGNNWNGGRIIREGRTLLYIGREHPMADTYGYVYEHRLVMASGLGRVLTTRDMVHHLDLDPTNNHPSNLVVLTGPEHRRVHNAITAGIPPLEALKVVLA